MVRSRGGCEVNVLVLNQNYEPLNVCNGRRALVLVDGGKAEVLEIDGLVLRSPTRSWRVPSVIRLNHFIRRPRPRVRLTRREVFLRDQYTCQYCGVQTRELTLDHVVPKHRGGRHIWENLVSACRGCNHRKGGKTIDDARMMLLHLPAEPKATPQYIFQHYLRANEAWQKFVPA
ncbi:MAG: HNH endonuclease [Chloroflexi bacterium]|nr:HNH endonuclease [Chloroflexota bacterium]